MTNSGKTKAIVLSVFILALVIRLAFVITAEPSRPFNADAGKYTRIAFNIANHGVYSPEASANPQANTWISPGYPLFLSGFSKSLRDFTPLGKLKFYKGVTLTQALLSALTVLLITYVGVYTLGHWWGCLAGCLVAFSPHLIAGTGYILTETLFITLVAATLLAWIMADFDKRPVLSWAIFGILCIAAAMVRPAYALFPFLLALIAAWNWRYSWKQLTMTMVVLLLATIVVWGPWKSYKLNHDPNNQTSQVAASFALGQYPNLTYGNAPRGFPYVADPQYKEMKENLTSAFIITLQRVSEEPGRYIQWYLIGKPVQFLSWGILVGYGGPYVYPFKDDILSSTKAGVLDIQAYRFAHWPIVLLASMVVLWSGLQMLKRKVTDDQSGRFLMFGGLLFIYFVAVHTVLAPLPRYSIPLHPIMYTLFVWGLAILARSGINRVSRFNQKLNG